MLHLCINKEKWNSLPKNYQAIVAQASEAANNWMLAKYDSVNAPALKRLLGKGTELRAFPQDTVVAAYKAAHDYYAEIAAKNPLFKKTMDSYMAFRDEQYLWWQVGDFSYDNLMIRLLRS